MAIFRAMWAGGKGVFAGAPGVVIPPASGGGGGLFLPMRAPNGSALLRGAIAGQTPVEQPPKQFEEQMTFGVTFSYEAGNANLFEDVLEAAMTFSFDPVTGLQLTDTLEATLDLTYDHAVQVQVEDRLEATLFLDFDVRARIRGWNEDKDLPPKDWKPDPKPNLF